MTAEPQIHPPPRSLRSRAGDERAVFALRSSPLLHTRQERRDTACREKEKGEICLRELRFFSKLGEALLLPAAPCDHGRAGIPAQGRQQQEGVGGVRLPHRLRDMPGGQPVREDDKGAARESVQDLREALHRCVFLSWDISPSPRRMRAAGVPTVEVVGLTPTASSAVVSASGFRCCARGQQVEAEDFSLAARPHVGVPR